MIVRVNDRGPYHANRLMDVSEEVAQALEVHRSGTAKVRVEYVGKASTAGSDDRKLMATLRTDGAPARVGGASPVMMADLGPDAETERLSRAQRPAMAFKPAPDEDDAAPAPRPARPAPVLVAGGSSVAVPAALQPTASRSQAFRPTMPDRPAPALQMAHAAPKAKGSPPHAVAAMRLASNAGPAQNLAQAPAPGIEARRHDDQGREDAPGQAGILRSEDETRLRAGPGGTAEDGGRPCSLARPGGEDGEHRDPGTLRDGPCSGGEPASGRASLGPSGNGQGQRRQAVRASGRFAARRRTGRTAASRPPRRSPPPQRSRPSHAARASPRSTDRRTTATGGIVSSTVSRHHRQSCVRFRGRSAIPSRKGENGPGLSAKPRGRRA